MLAVEKFWIECLQENKLDELLVSIRECDSGFYDRGYFFISKMRIAFERDRRLQDTYDKASKFYYEKLQQFAADY